MNEKIAVVLLSKLKQKTRKQFYLFLNSPYYNKNQTIVDMGNDIEKFIMLKKADFTFESYYYDKLKRTLSQTTFLKNLSIVNKLLKKFAICEQLELQEINQEFLLLKFFDFKNFDVFYNNQLKQLEKVINNADASFDNYLHKFEYMQAKVGNLSFKAEERFGGKSINEHTESLNRLYVSHNMFSVLFRMTKVKIISGDNNLSELEEEYLSLKKIYNQPDVIIDLICDLIELNLIAPSKLKAAFDKTVIKLRNIATKIDKETALNFYILLANNANTVYKQQAYYRFMFNFYKEQVENKVAFFDGRIISTIFKNIVEMAIKNKEFDWLSEFLETNKNNIAPASISKDMYNYCQTKLMFTQGKYKEVCTSIRTLKFKDVYCKLAVKRLELLANFELKDWLFLETLVNSFRVTIVETRNEKMGEKHREYYRTFIKYFYHLFKIFSDVNKPDKKAVLALENELKATSNFPEKDWIVLKLNEYKKSKQN